MIYSILNILGLIALSFILSIGMNVIYHWTARTLLTKKYRWVCEHCGDILICDVQPFCKACTHIERTTKKMIRLKK